MSFEYLRTIGVRRSIQRLPALVRHDGLCWARINPKPRTWSNHANGIDV
jgi:hypothetical protein